MKKTFMMVGLVSCMFSISAFAQVATDESCAVGYKGVESFATCVDGKLFARPYAEGKSAVELGYVGAEEMATFVRDPIPTSEQFRKEACDKQTWDAEEVYGCKK